MNAKFLGCSSLSLHGWKEQLHMGSEISEAQAKLHPGEPHQQFALVLRDNDLGSTENFTAFLC